MANRVTVLAMYDRLGFSPQASEIIFVNQGMDELSELSILCNAEVDSLCKLVCMPGDWFPTRMQQVLGRP